MLKRIRAKRVGFCSETGIPIQINESILFNTVTGLCYGEHSKTYKEQDPRDMRHIINVSILDTERVGICPLQKTLEEYKETGEEFHALTTFGKHILCLKYDEGNLQTYSGIFKVNEDQVLQIITLPTSYME